jgi:hypothetical protein
MTDQELEDELREVFSRAVSQIPADAADRLNTISYRPRTLHLSPRAVFATLSSAAATIGTIVSVIVFTGTAPAFAGWTTSPTTASAGQTTAAQSNCQSQLAGLPSTTSQTSWNPVVTDVRGPFTLVVYADSGRDVTCLTGSSLTIVSETDGIGGSTRVLGGSTRIGVGRGHVGATVTSSGLVLKQSYSDRIRRLMVTHFISTAEGSYTLIEGQVSSVVSAVTLVRSDGVNVATTTAGGWLVAWWPGDGNAISAEVTTASGVSAQTLPTRLSPAPQGSCATNSEPTTTETLCTNTGTSGDSGESGNTGNSGASDNAALSTGRSQ